VLGPAAVLLAAALLLRAAAPTAQTARLPLRERELTSGGAWSWFGDPRAVYHEGTYRRTYTGWVAPDGSIQVASYDHDSGRRGIVTLKARLQIDDHDTPSLLVLPDGRLMVFWSTHAGPTMWYRRSLRPEDISAWEPERKFPTNTPGVEGYTYPNPMQLEAEGNLIYLFWRGGNFNPSLSTSRDGNTWSAARTVIYNPGQRPYVKYASNGRDTIAMAFTETHPRNRQTSIYYAAYRAGALRRADGSVIATMANLPIAPTEGEKVYDWTTNGKAWVHDVALDQAGHPVIVYATFPRDTDHRYRYARWDGTRWTDRELVRAGRSMSVAPGEPNYSGGVTLDHEDPSIVYLSRQVKGAFQIEVWTTRDGGATWSSRPLTSPSAGNNYRPVSPRGQRGDDMSIVWMHGTYPSYTSFETSLRSQVRARDGAAARAPRRLDVLGRLVGLPMLASSAQARPHVDSTDRQRHDVVQPIFNGDWSSPVPLQFNTTTIMADANPRSTPIPISEQARAAE
jgi:BNR repeat-containing family member